MMTSMDFDDSYRDSEAVFGTTPERTLLQFEAQLDRTRPMLDLGAGQGRNAVRLARGGLTVDALEPSAEAAAQLRARVEADGLPMVVHRVGFEAFSGRPSGYGAVLAFGLIQLLDWAGVHRLVQRTRDWLVPDGLTFVTAFRTDDPAYPRIAASWRRAAERSFVSDAGDRRTYLLPGEITEIYAGFDVLHLWEGLGPEHHHGDGALERHALVEAVLRAPR